MNVRISSGRIKQGDYTRQVYTWIKFGQYKEAISFLTEQSLINHNSREALSLLGYCFYMIQDFANAALSYESLSSLYPDNDNYKLNYARSLYQLCSFDDALRVTLTIDNRSTMIEKGQLVKLQSVIKYGQDDLTAARSLIDQLAADDPDREVNQGCVLYKESRYEEALTKFLNGLTIEGYKPDLSYNVALCYYQLKQYPLAMKYIGDIIEKGIRDHPELSVGMTTEGIEVRSVGNTITLHETALVEAFNLKAAIEYQNKNMAAAQEALTDIFNVH
uniref:Tetratricopeptide repeat protein 30 n=1 Tax=Tetranychus urticae TaxID=32264 RepID=T1JQG3_TETUR